MEAIARTAPPQAPRLDDAETHAQMHAGMQAVVVVHGMGEQRPMDTIKNFVRAVWVSDPDITRNDLPNPTMVWSKPDSRTGSLELRRITTRETIASPPEFPAGVRTDFYELYWADLTAGSTWDQFTSWVFRLLLRPWSLVPPDVRSAWVLLAFLSVLVALLAVIGVLPATVWSCIGWPWLENWHWLLTAVAVAATAGIHKVVAATFGRVVRYTRADPDNIAARAAVRERGLALLRALHQGKGYQRIVIVSHSLGTILAHDLLGYFWAEREAARCIREDSPEFENLAALERAAARIAEPAPGEKDFDAYFAAQRELRLALARRPAPDQADPKAPDRRWLISDFVTLGSPLAHAEFLLASDRNDLDNREAARELPTSPPCRELLDPGPLSCAERTQKLPIAVPREQSQLCSFPIPPAYQVWELHHAAPFAAVRWTNVYDPAKLVFFGDVIGGPLAGVLGPAIIDVDLRWLRGRQSGSFTHTKYWEIDDEPVHIEALRRAVNLLDRPDSNPNSLKQEMAEPT
jgi:hypothetical protein